MTATFGTTPSLIEDRSRQVRLAHLLHRIAASDRAAFALLYDALSSEIRQHAQAALSVGDAADAVVAATFLQVWWLAPLHDPDDEDVPAWIHAIVSGRIADRRRNAASTPSAVHTSMQRSPWSALSSAYDETVAAALAQLLGRRGQRQAF